MKNQIRILVKGRVQGVFYRNYTQEFALNLGIKGKVRNLKNGDVEIFAHGEKEQLESLINWTKKGSPLSKVTDVSFDEIDFNSIVWTEFFVEQGKY
ncbi:MAG: acylphosphatase [Bacteroidia bacterium]